MSREGRAMRGTLKRSAVLLAVAASLFVLSGCGTYWRNRGDDFSEMFDIGATYSKDWHWVFYQSFESILTVGYADFDATFVGWGGGQFGATPHYLKAWGALVYGDEQAGWGDYDKADRDTLYCQTVGIVGMPLGMVNGNSNPHYVPT